LFSESAKQSNPQKNKNFLKGSYMKKNHLVSLCMVLALLLSLFITFGATERTNTGFIDVLLLIDSSGSMNWLDRDPEGLSIQGAKLFIDLCEKGDRIGVMDFSTDANIISPLHEIFSIHDVKLLKEKIDKIVAKGEFTDITLALQTALKEMTRARDNVVKAVILLTDGEIDPDPSRPMFSPYNRDYLREIGEATRNQAKISKIKEKYKNIVAPISKEYLRNEVLPDYIEQKIPIFTVAFGHGADKELLREIADSTTIEIGIRNYYFIEKASHIQPVFSEIVEQLKKVREIVIEKVIEFTGEEIVHKINIDDFISEVNFKFIFAKKITQEDVQISLKDPNGDIISRTTSKEGIGHIFEEGYELYNIFNPLPGTWEVIIRGRKDVKLEITISTWGRTDLKILTEVLKDEYFVGDSIPILASLQLEGKTITSPDFLKNLKFIAKIENPKSQVEKLELYDDGSHGDRAAGDGIYGNSFTNTSIPGDYLFRIKAQGETTGMKRFAFTRESEYRVRVLSKPEVIITPPVEPIGPADTVEPEEQEEKRPFPYLFIILIVISIAIIFLIAILWNRARKSRPLIEGEEVVEGREIILPPEEPLEIFSVTEKIKDGKEVVIGSKQIKHSSVGEKNLILNRSRDKFYIRAGEGTLELNNEIVSEEREVKDGDVIKVGELYFEVKLNPLENKVNLLGISEEQASLRIKEE